MDTRHLDTATSCYALVPQLPVSGVPSRRAPTKLLSTFSIVSRSDNHPWTKSPSTSTSKCFWKWPAKYVFMVVWTCRAARWLRFQRETRDREFPCNLYIISHIYLSTLEHRFAVFALKVSHWLKIHSGLNPVNQLFRSLCESHSLFTRVYWTKGHGAALS